jgi:hypothetical protein
MLEVLGAGDGTRTHDLRHRAHENPSRPHPTSSHAGLTPTSCTARRQPHTGHAIEEMELAMGLEPMTCRLQGGCSGRTELRQQKRQDTDPRTRATS